MVSAKCNMSKCNINRILNRRLPTAEHYLFTFRPLSPGYPEHSKKWHKKKESKTNAPYNFFRRSYFGSYPIYVVPLFFPSLSMKRVKNCIPFLFFDSSLFTTLTSIIPKKCYFRICFLCVCHSECRNSMLVVLSVL